MNKEDEMNDKGTFIGLGENLKTSDSIKETVEEMILRVSSDKNYKNRLSEIIGMFPGEESVAEIIEDIELMGGVREKKI